MRVVTAVTAQEDLESRGASRYHTYILLKQTRGSDAQHVGQTKNYIVLNGKHYDATTGELIATAPTAHTTAKPAPAAAKAPVKAPVKAPAGKAIDGLHRPVTKVTAPAAKAVAPKVAAAKPAVKPTAKPVMDMHRTPASHLARRKQQHSQTLMRKSVKRPAPGLKRVAKSQTRTDILAKVPAQHITPKPSVRRVDEKRLQHATGVNKSQLVSHFNASAAKPAVKPAVKPSTQPIARPTAAKPMAKPLQPARPVISPVTSVRSHDVRPVHAAGGAAGTAPRQASMDIFEQALARANSHNETAVDPKKLARAHKKKANRRIRRLISSVAAAMAVLVIGSFIAVQNTANLKMHLASSRAGVHATLPGHEPAGFAAVKFSYGNGFVTVDYHNPAGDHNYQVTQTTSNWDSSALRNEYVAATAGDHFRAVQAGGRTIYTYGNHNATWIDGGIWYNITSDGSLSDGDLIDVAKSM